MRKLLLTLSLLLLTIHSAHACRFWAAVGEKIPEGIIAEELLEEPNSLKKLGDQYRDGWSVGYYENGVPIVFRGIQSSSEDEHFDRSVRDSADVDPHVIFAHLRRASSGCKGIPNPHPFAKYANGKEWLFGHNGGIRKQILIDLISESYLKDHPPSTCTFDPPNSWIDSELYLIFVLKEIEQHNWEVEIGLRSALRKLYSVIDEDKRYLNFFLTDGDSLWAFKKGNSLYYVQDEEKKYLAVTSSVPQMQQEPWITFPDDHIAVLEPGHEIRLIDTTAE